VLHTEAEAIERADLVVLATPTPLHFAQCKRALSAGCHVLVEKPLAEDAAEARTLCDLARDRNVRLVVGHSERFNPVVRALARALKDETILRIATRRTAATASREDVCLNLAVHDIDLVAFLSRESVEVDAAWGTPSESLVSLRAGAVSATVSVGRTNVSVRTLEVKTHEASYVGDLLAPRLSRDGVIVELEHSEPLALQAEETLASLADVATTIASGDDGARAVALATRAAQLRRRASVEASAAE
jgi:predicted dehydrogenase